MAHQLEMTADGKASFAYSGEIGSAWHQLGVELPGLSNVEEILAAARCDFAVYKDVLWAVDPMDPEEQLPTGRSFTWRNRFTYDDKGTPNGEEKQVLGIVGNEYRVIQNSTALEFALELAGQGPGERGVDCAGLLDDGRRFFATVPLPELVIDPQGVNDRHGRNLVVVTGHDGKQSLELVQGFTRAVCANTVAAALRGSSHHVTIRHVGNQDVPVAVVKKALSLALTADEEFVALAHGMLETPTSWAEVERIADKLFPLKAEANDREKHNRDRRLGQLQTLWVGPTGSAGVGENRWAAFNVFTEWMEHQQHIVGKSNEYNRALRAVESPGFNKRVHKLARALRPEVKRPVSALGA